ncbi:hypothetical protein AnigIFM56816_006111 [Aspergillus niger]|nr:hypothetical protein AnigIFM56816_006111 [Aspergillus niger]
MDSMGIDEFRIGEDVASSIVESSNDGLEELTVLYHDSSDDADIELYIFACFLLFWRTYSLQWAEKAIRKAQQWTASTALGDYDYRRRFRIITSIRSVAITRGPTIVGDEALEMQILNNLFNGARYRVTGSIEDLTDTINYRGTLLPSIPPMHKPKAMMDLAAWLVLRFEEDQQTYLDDLKIAIKLVSAVLSTDIPHPFSHAGLLVQVGQWSYKLYACDSNLGTLNNSIEAYRHALRLACGEAEMRLEICLQLANALLVRALKTANPAEFVEPTTTLAGLLEEPSLDHSNRSAVLNSLAVSASMYFQLSGDIQDLIRSIGYIEMILGCPSFKKTSKIEPIMNLIQTLIKLIKHLENPSSYDVLRQATALLDIAITGYTGDDFPYATLLHPAGLLAEHFDATKRLEHLEQACKLTKLASCVAPLGSQRAECLCIMSQRLSILFHNSSNEEHLNEAILCAEQAVKMVSSDDSIRSSCLADLGAFLLERSQASHRSEDLYYAKGVLLEASQLVPSTHDIWSIVMQNISAANFLLFRLTQDAQFLDLAIDTLDGMLLQQRPVQSKLPYLLSNLALLLCHRADGNRGVDEDAVFMNRWMSGLHHSEPLIWKFNGSVADVDRALELMHTVLQSVDDGHHDWAHFHLHLSLIYMHRYMMFLTRPDLGRNALAELDSAISAQEIAQNSLPSTHASRADLWAKLSATLSARYYTTHDPADYDKIMHCLSEGMKCYQNDPRTRIHLARCLAINLIQSADYMGASRALEEAVRLLPRACPRSSSGYDKQQFLATCYGLASLSAGVALAIDRPFAFVLETLEGSRGLVAGFFLDARTDLSALRSEDPDLARKFESLGEELNRDSINIQGLFHFSAQNEVITQDNLEANRNIQLQREFDDLVGTIRGKKGFRGFLLSPTLDEMMATACHGPIVVINICPFRSDAIIIQKNHVGSVRLPHLKYEIVKDLAHKLINMNSYEIHTSQFLHLLLSWLWVALARPVLDYLGYTHTPEQGEPWPHIWWIPTGETIYFPIHAAGIHDKDTDETVMDRVVSSYASSIRSLIHSRRGGLAKPPSSTKYRQQALLVSMPETPNQSSLPFAVNEIATIEPLIQDMGLTPTHRKSENTNEVLKSMKNSTILHFAGHGMSHASDPTQSCLLTQDWTTNPLTVERLRQENLQDTSPFLAYLSSCSTGANKNLKLADETIHLVNACQLAGFRHAIGALWEVSDQHCVEVARGVYETLKEEGLADEAVARGLHRATRRVRDSCRDVTMRNGRSTGIKEKVDFEDDIDKQLGYLEREFRVLGIDAKLGSDDRERDAELVDDDPRPQVHAPSFLWVPYFHHGA